MTYGDQMSDFTAAVRNTLKDLKESRVLMIPWESLQ